MPCGPLSWCEGLAALQATCFVARRDESAIGAHPQWREVSVVWLHSKQLSQRSGQKGTQTTNPNKKRMPDRVHNRIPRFFSRRRSRQCQVILTELLGP